MGAGNMAEYLDFLMYIFTDVIETVFLLFFLGKILKKKKDKTAEDLEFERAIAGSYDISDRAYIEPLVSFLGRSSR